MAGDQEEDAEKDRRDRQERRAHGRMKGIVTCVPRLIRVIRPRMERTRMHHAAARAARLARRFSPLILCAALAVTAAAPAPAQESPAQESPAQESKDVGTKEAGPAIAPYRLVVARLDSIEVAALAAHSNAVGDYEAGDVADGLALLFDAGSGAVGLDRAGVFPGDYPFATDAPIG
ncbi:MAG TPA: hypothetical protein PKA74_14915, partial [Bauldia sp.]|nr:hypothetical protein [Bauldia sp.]